MIDGASRNRCAEDNLIRTIECETNDIAVFQGVSTNLLSIKKNAATLTTVFEIVAILDGNGCSVPGDTAIGKLQLLSAAASNKKRSLIDADRTKRRIRSNDLQACFADWGGVNHGRQSLPAILAPAELCRGCNAGHGAVSGPAAQQRPAFQETSGSSKQESIAISHKRIITCPRLPKKCLKGAGAAIRRRFRF